MHWSSCRVPFLIELLEKCTELQKILRLQRDEIHGWFLKMLERTWGNPDTNGQERATERKEAVLACPRHRKFMLNVRNKHLLDKSVAPMNASTTYRRKERTMSQRSVSCHWKLPTLTKKVRRYRHLRAVMDASHVLETSTSARMSNVRGRFER